MIFAASGIRLVDFGLEYGREYIDSDDVGKLIVGDEITPDTCRLWDIKTNERFDRETMELFPKEAKEIYKKLANRVIKKLE
ncbi:phosphoribosylaminoimidazolesuccinocarboxamide synthase [Candidatus Xenohaliotis californiensis]|uniref:phosphoribosylaminoimidazolesuccinocarboxamide synthase n=1 Tax=Candidatus Xenohaliotis californiensis TaxID=84677 RepID=UPI0030C86BBC